MTKNKRFELTMNGNDVAQYEIIDHNQEVLTIYNDLGNVYFSSAMKVCELLNNLEDENEWLKKNNKEYIRGLDLRKAELQSWKSDVRELREQNCRLEKENEQLKIQIRIFEEFLKHNNLDIDWGYFCTVDECPLTDEDEISCKECKYLRWLE